MILHVSIALHFEQVLVTDIIESGVLGRTGYPRGTRKWYSHRCILPYEYLAFVHQIGTTTFPILVLSHPAQKRTPKLVSYKQPDQQK